MRTLVAAHLLNTEGLSYAAHLRVDDPEANNIIWKAAPTFEFGETEWMRWATLAEAQKVAAGAFECEVD